MLSHNALQIDSLLGEFKQQTGQSFGGSDSDYSILSQLVSVLSLSCQSQALVCCSTILVRKHAPEV